jgi:hypothetical protein
MTTAPVTSIKIQFTCCAEKLGYCDIPLEESVQYTLKEAYEAFSDIPSVKKTIPGNYFHLIFEVVNDLAILYHGDMLTYYKAFGKTWNHLYTQGKVFDSILIDMVYWKYRAGDPISI